MSSEAVKEMGLKLVEEQYNARRLGAASLAACRLEIKRFYKWADGQGLKDIRKVRTAELLQYRKWLRETVSTRAADRLKPGTVNGRFRYVRALYSALYRFGLMDSNPAGQLVEDLPRQESTRRPLTEEEITTFLDQFDTTAPQGLKDRAMFELIYSSGLRVSEAAGLKVAKIDFERLLLKVHGKGDKERIVPLSRVAADVLLIYLGERVNNLDDWVFPGRRLVSDEHIKSTSISERFRDLLRRFDMDDPHISAHSIRHSTATHLLDHGAGVRHVQELLGHSTIESTARYTHVVTDHLKRLHRKHHPRENALFEDFDRKEYEKRLERVVKPEARD